MPPKSKTTAECGLCGETAELQASHVVPEFAYAPIYDAKHKIYAIDPLRPERQRKIQKGLREPLLCRSCEQFLNDKYEKWFKEMWLDDPRPLQPLEVRDRAILKIVDPARFKLFHLSVLLRADLAKKGQWSEVDVGPKHRTRLKEMVLGQDPGESHEFPVVCVPIRFSPENPRLFWDFVGPPNPGRIEGVRFYEVPFAACGWVYIVSSHSTPLIGEVAMHADGTLPVIKTHWQGFRRWLEGRAALA